jgi:magnesium chelatase family protein
MLSSVKTASLWGLEGHLVEVEIDVSRGLPSWNVVGLGDKTIREAAERIKAAMSNSGFQYPRQRITVNLAPAGKPKAGTHFDLPIAIGLMAASGGLDPGAAAGYAFIGELSLGGGLSRVRGVLPLVTTCADAGISRVILPGANAEEASMVKGIEVYAADDLTQVLAHLRGESKMEPYGHRGLKQDAGIAGGVDFDDIWGQDAAKRAMVICAAGCHGLLMIGPPGTGKSLMAGRLPSILPPLTYREQMEVTRIYSVAGLLDDDQPVITRRPFRAPHQNVTMAAMFGGGARPVPGEFSLAHTGVFFTKRIRNDDIRATIRCL